MRWIEGSDMVLGCQKEQLSIWSSISDDNYLRTALQ